MSRKNKHAQDQSINLNLLWLFSFLIVLFIGLAVLSGTSDKKVENVVLKPNIKYLNEYQEIVNGVSSEQTLWESMPRLADFVYRMYCEYYPGCLKQSPKVYIPKDMAEFASLQGLSELQARKEGFINSVAMASNLENAIIVNPFLPNLRLTIAEIESGGTTSTWRMIVYKYTFVLMEEVYHLDALMIPIEQPFEFRGRTFIYTRGLSFVETGNYKIVNIEEGSVYLVIEPVLSAYLGLKGTEQPYEDLTSWVYSKSARSGVTIADLLYFHRSSDPVGLLKLFYPGSSNPIVDYINEATP